MADAPVNGTDIIFKVGGNPVGGETGVTLSVGGEPIEVTNKDTADWKAFIAGRADWTVSGSSMLLLDTTAQTMAASQKSLFTAISTRSEIAVELVLAGNLKFSGAVLLTQYEIGGPDNEEAVLNWTGRGNGALTLAEGV